MPSTAGTTSLIQKPAPRVNKPLFRTSLALRSSNRLVWAVVICLAATYLLQMFSPLRLNGDATVFLSLGDSVASGHGFLYHGAPTQFPPGYPLMLGFLNAMQIGYSWSYIALNLLFLGAGIAACYSLLIRDLGLPELVAGLIVCLTLLSYVLVKHTTLPQSDIPFFGLSMLTLFALLSFREATGSGTVYQLALALLLLACAIMVRTAGIALIPPFLPALYLRLQRAGVPAGSHRRRWLILGAAGVVVVVLLRVFIAQTKYFQEILIVVAHAPSEGGYVLVAVYNAWTHLVEYGETVMNAPIARMPALLQTAVPFAGIVMLVVAARGAMLGRKLGTVTVYVASYLLMLFIYVGYDARYWIPVAPLLMGLQARALIGTRTGRRAALVYAAGFAALGVAALGYSTTLSLSGTRFAELYGTEQGRGVYRVGFGLSTPESEVDLDQEAVQLLRRHDGRAR
jgi:hypothetical protein